uniref:Phosphofructokinase n=1 Tax=Gopherus evgoodei TaxID=1825980 RepID=A0A8C4WC85_9SAUR
VTHQKHERTRNLGSGKAIAVLTSGGDAQGKEIRNKLWVCFLCLLGFEPLGVIFSSFSP